jgi:hypothetical protein
VIVIGVPMKPEDGVTLSAEMVALGVDAVATGPGSGATPERAGDVRTMGVVADCNGAAAFFTTGALALCLWTAAELALVPIMSVEHSSATVARPTDIALVLREFK